MEKKSKLVGAAAQTIAAPVALAAGLVGGTVNVVTGHGGFEEGFDNTTDDVMGSAKDFGEDHGHAIIDGIVRGTASSLSSRAVNGGTRNSAD
jgi:hypothetical protein